MIFYSSRTGNVKYICDKLNNIKCINIDKLKEVSEEFILFTYTDGLGNVPKKVDEFMKINNKYCKGIICSGNTNFGNDVFCKAADILSEQYNIPLIRKIELRGFKSDYEYIENEYNKIIGGYLNGS